MNQIKAGAVLNYVIIALNTITGLLYTPFMLRCLGQNEYGLYSLVASIIAYLTILDFGFGNAIVRYTAKFRAEGKTKEQWEMFGMFVIVYSLIGLLAFFCGLGLYYNVDALFDQTMTADDLSKARVMMLLLTVNLAFTFPFTIFSSIISAYENFVFQRILNIVRLVLSTLVMICLLSAGYKAIAMVVVQTIFNLSTLLINYVYARRKLKIKIVFGRFNLSFFKEVSIYSFWIFLNAIMDRIYWSTGQFVLGAAIGPIAVAVFSVAITLQQMYMTFSTAISSVLLPRITQMVASNRTDKEISDVFISTGRIQAIVMMLILSGFTIFGNSFVALWAGNAYSESYYIALIFFGALFIPLIQNVGINILQARNQMKFRSLCYVVIAGLSLVLQVVLAKLMGPIGCAIAIGGALLLGQGLVMNIYYQRVQRLDIIKFWREILKMAIAPLAITIISLYILKYYHIESWSGLMIGIISFAMVYMPLFWVFSMNNYERSLLASPIKAAINKIRV